jgi:hypothetical protein
MLILTFKSDTRFALFEQKLMEMGQKFDHLERKLDQKTDRIFWWVISLLTALCRQDYPRAGFLQGKCAA